MWRKSNLLDRMIKIRRNGRKTIIKKSEKIVPRNHNKNLTITLEKVEKFASTSGTTTTISLFSFWNDARTHGSRPWRGEAQRKRSNPIKIRNTNRLNSTHAVSQRERSYVNRARPWIPAESNLLLRRMRGETVPETGPERAEKYDSGSSWQPILRADPHRDGLRPILIFDRSELCSFTNRRDRIRALSYD